jgi:hypothetical protein
MLFAMKIRKKVTIEQCDVHVWSVYPNDPFSLPYHPLNMDEVSSPDFVLSRDPRIPAVLGYRILSRLPISYISDVRKVLSLGEEELVQQSVRQYQRMLHTLGVGEGPADHPHGYVYPMECNADILNGMSFMKGMHTGDWLTGRNVRRGVDFRLLPVTLSNTGNNSHRSLPPDSAITLPDGSPVGVIRSMNGTTGLASLRWKQVFRELNAGSGELVHGITGSKLQTGLPFWWRQGVAGLPADHPKRFPVPAQYLPQSVM